MTSGVEFTLRIDAIGTYLKMPLSSDALDIARKILMVAERQLKKRGGEGERRG